MIISIKAILINAVRKDNFPRRFLFCLLSVIGMASSMSLLMLVNLGTDPCTLFDIAVSERFGIGIGNWHVLYNCILFLIVIRFGADNLGVGTLLNMTLAGYVFQYFTFIWKHIIPEEFFSLLYYRIAILIPTLFIFCFFVALYMNVEMGITPYDALPYIITAHFPGIPFRLIRILFDFTITVISILLGGRAGLLTVILVLCLGPAISGLRSFQKKYIV